MPADHRHRGYPTGHPTGHPAGHPAATARRAVLLGGAGLLLAGCTRTPSAADAGGTPAATDGRAAPVPTTPAATAAQTPASTPSTPSTPAPPPGLTAADVTAGVLRREVPQGGGGVLVVVPGSSPAPASARVRTVRVEVEQDLLDAGVLDPVAFAGFALTVLNDPRGWGAGGATSFARTDGDAQMRLVLATPDTSAALCRPLRTMGTMSCRTGDAAVLTWYRWVEAIPDYGEDRTGYRQYVVNHEIGHVLGHGHEPHPGVGRPAPVMMQQTKGLKGALPNPWPHP
ncbi:DUF3152 domain-containing protein [Kineococcus sp. SYSU DK002]|uniref:DUF3152 domain-containing protein n=1 Tax=Kineococcus sp. SYSU DK002 TaxID=3383123 RepID=UPI003D7D20F1